MSVYPDNFYFLLIPSDADLLLSNVNLPLYTQPYLREKILPVKFSVILFHTEEKLMFCRQRSIVSLPVLQKFSCISTTFGVDTPKLDPSNYPSTPEFNWADTTFGFATKTQLSKMVISIALQKLNATTRIKLYDECEDPVLTEACLYPEFKHEDLIAVVLDNQHVVTHFPGIYFFSCYESSGRVSFSLYLSPFPSLMWILIVILLLLSTFLLSIGFYALTRKVYPITIFLRFYGSVCTNRSCDCVHTYYTHTQTS